MQPNNSFTLDFCTRHQHANESKLAFGDPTFARQFAVISEPTAVVSIFNFSTVELDSGLVYIYAEFEPMPNMRCLNGTLLVLSADPADAGMPNIASLNSSPVNITCIFIHASDKFAPPITSPPYISGSTAPRPA